MTKTASAIQGPAPLNPACAMDSAAASVSAKFLGFTPASKADSPKALPGSELVNARHPLGHVRLFAFLWTTPPLADGHQEEQQAEQQLDHVGQGGRRTSSGNLAEDWPAPAQCCRPPRGPTPSPPGRRNRCSWPARLKSIEVSSDNWDGADKESW